jgi:hypothetical protein
VQRNEIWVQRQNNGATEPFPGRAPFAALERRLANKYLRKPSFYTSYSLPGWRHRRPAHDLVHFTRLLCQ